MELYLDLLDTIARGTNKITHIVYATNTSSDTAYPKINHLLSKGLIKKMKGKYYITEEGHIALRHGLDFRWAVTP